MDCSTLKYHNIPQHWNTKTLGYTLLSIIGLALATQGIIHSSCYVVFPLVCHSLICILICTPCRIFAAVLLRALMYIHVCTYMYGSSRLEFPGVWDWQTWKVSILEFWSKSVTQTIVSLPESLHLNTRQQADDVLGCTVHSIVPPSLSFHKRTHVCCTFNDLI